MLQLFRSFMNSKLGVIVTLGALAIIALAFAVGDVAHMGTFGGVTGSDRVAIVGKAKISTSDLNSAVQNDFEQVRRENPTATMESFIAAGGMSQALQQLLDRTALAEFGKSAGLRAGDRLVDSQLTQTAAFHGADGKFDEKLYRQLIQRQGLTDKLVREDFAAGLLSRQVMFPLSMGSEMPLSLVKRYAALLKENRKGGIGLLLSDAYAPANPPTDDQLKAYYSAHRTEYLRPERRTIRYFTFDDSALGALPAPSDAEIAAQFKRDEAKYAASETRRMTQLVVPTKQAADAIAAEVAKGKPLVAAAREKGLDVTQVGPVSQADLAGQTSVAVAQAAFATPQGKLAAPARGGLGYYLLKIDAIDRKPARSLEQVKGEISSALATEKRRVALAELSSKIEDQIDNGSSFAELAKSLKLEPKSVSDVIGTGQIYGKAGATVPAELKAAVGAAFDMQEGEPQMSEVLAGKSFLIYEVSDITPSAAAPLNEIKDTIAQAWKRSEGAKAAKAAADRVMKRVQSGQTIPAALAAEKVKLPAPDTINMNREQLAKLGGRVPPVIALMFSMAQGTTKRLEAPNNNGWFVVKLDQIEVGKLADNDPLIAQAGNQLSKAMEQEYAEQMVKSVAAAVGIERNESAIKAVEAQLTGRNNRE